MQTISSPEVSFPLPAGEGFIDRRMLRVAGATADGKTESDGECVDVQDKEVRGRVTNMTVAAVRGYR